MASPAAASRRSSCMRCKNRHLLYQRNKAGGGGPNVPVGPVAAAAAVSGPGLVGLP